MLIRLSRTSFSISKFAGVAMIGGVTLNGEQIYTQALADIEKLEEEIKSLQEHQAMLLG